MSMRRDDVASTLIRRHLAPNAHWAERIHTAVHKTYEQYDLNSFSDTFLIWYSADAKFVIQELKIPFLSDFATTSSI